MLTNVAVQRARTKPCAYKLADGGGLALHVAPTGNKTWRWRFRYEGKETTLVLGTHPETTLEEARSERDRRRAALDRGEDPRAARAADAARPSTFEPAARAWHAHRLSDWSPKHAEDVLASFERDVFPAIGAMRLDEVAPPDVLRLLRAIEARGNAATAHRVRWNIGRVFALARSEHWTTNNPAGDVGEAMKRVRAARHHPALERPAELRELLAEADRAIAAPVVKLASRLLALTAVRFGALRGARWSEIEDLDGPAPLWRVPAARMKLKADKKLKAVNDHLVPLSSAAVAVLRAARANLHPGDADIHGAALIFAGRARGEPIGEKSIENLYKRTSFAGRHVPHGWRASFSTILNLDLPGERGAIDKALAHAGGRDEEAQGINRAVEGSYNRGVDLDRRRRLFDRWAEILNAAEVDEASQTERL